MAPDACEEPASDQPVITAIRRLRWIRKLIVHELEAVDAVIAQFEAEPGSVPADEMLSVKQAAQLWNVEVDAARKRVRRIGQKLSDGRWYAPRSRVERDFQLRPPSSPDAGR